MQNLMFDFTCDEWRSCYQDWGQEFAVDVDDPLGVEIEAQCDVCYKWHHQLHSQEAIAIMVAEQKPKFV